MGKTNIKQPESFPGERKQNLNPFPTSLILPYGTQSPPPRAVFSPFLAQVSTSSFPLSDAHKPRHLTPHCLLHTHIQGTCVQTVSCVSPVYIMSHTFYHSHTELDSHFYFHTHLHPKSHLSCNLIVPQPLPTIRSSHVFLHRTLHSCVEARSYMSLLFCLSMG